jgi:hypothetical protein
LVKRVGSRSSGVPSTRNGPQPLMFISSRVPGLVVEVVVEGKVVVGAAVVGAAVELVATVVGGVLLLLLLVLVLVLVGTVVGLVVVSDEMLPAVEGVVVAVAVVVVVAATVDVLVVSAVVDGADVDSVTAAVTDVVVGVVGGKHESGVRAMAGRSHTKCRCALHGASFQEPGLEATSGWPMPRQYSEKRQLLGSPDIHRHETPGVQLAYAASAGSANGWPLLHCHGKLGATAVPLSLGRNPPSQRSVV